MLYGMIAGVAGLGLAGALAMGGMCNPEMMNDPSMRRMMEPGMPMMQGMGGTMGSMEMPMGGMMNEQATQALPAEATKVATIQVEGMTCGGCAIGVRTALKRLDGVARADVSYEDERAVVTFDPEKVSTDRMLEAIRKFGYTVTLVSVEDRA
jgi:mercuric transport protein